MRGARSREMRGRERDVRGQILKPRALLLRKLTDEKHGAPQCRRLFDCLIERRNMHGLCLMQCAVLPLVKPRVGIALLRIHQGERIDARHGEGERERRQRRNPNERDPEPVSDRLRRRESDAKPREGAGADAHGDACERRFLDAREGERALDMREQRLRMCMSRLDRHLGCELSRARHGDARHRARRINRQNRQRSSSPRKIL